MARFLGLLLALAAVQLCAAIKVNWTPNGEAPLPFSQKAREAMGAAGQAAPAAPPPLSPLQLGLAEVASAGGLLLALMLINLGEPFALNDWINPSTLKKLTSRVRELLAPLLASFSGGEREVVEAAPSRVPRSKVTKVVASTATSSKSESAVRKARMERMAAASKAKAEAAAEAAASADESAAVEEEEA